MRSGPASREAGSRGPHRPAARGTRRCCRAPAGARGRPHPDGDQASDSASHLGSDPPWGVRRPHRSAVLASASLGGGARLLASCAGRRVGAAGSRGSRPARCAGRADPGSRRAWSDGRGPPWCAGSSVAAVRRRGTGQPQPATAAVRRRRDRPRRPCRGGGCDSFRLGRRMRRSSYDGCSVAEPGRPDEPPQAAGSSRKPARGRGRRHVLSARARLSDSRGAAPRPAGRPTAGGGDQQRRTSHVP